MKNIPLFCFVLLFIGISSCKDDDDNQVDCNSNNEEEVIGFKNYEVDFYSTHENFVIQEATFEAVTEQALRKPAHQEGAFFEILNEQYLVKDEVHQH